MLKILLEMWNYQVIEAENGASAVWLTEKTLPDLILMDVRMPELDGFETARRIRASAETDGVPIIFLSGCVEPAYREQAFQAGGNEFLVKPLDFKELEDLLSKYLQ